MNESTKTARLPPEVSGQTPARETVALDRLMTDSGTQVRAEISEFIVAEYVEALGEGARFPPVVVFRADGADVLADGFHRVRAYQQAGRDEIEADVYQGGPAEALWFALGANRAHGQRLNEGDKRRAIELAYEAWPDVSQRRIATHVGCSHQYVGMVRGQLAILVASCRSRSWAATAADVPRRGHPGSGSPSHPTMMRCPRRPASKSTAPRTLRRQPMRRRPPGPTSPVRPRLPSPRSKPRSRRSPTWAAGRIRHHRRKAAGEPG